MNKSTRLALLVLGLWGLVALLAVLLPSLPSPLVGARAPLPSLASGAGLRPADLAAYLDVLKTTPLWGVARDGEPLPAAVKEQEKPAVWAIIAGVVRKHERYALIVTDKAPLPQAIEEDGELPNGGRLISVRPRQIVYDDAQGQRHTLTFNY